MFVCQQVRLHNILLINALCHIQKKKIWKFYVNHWVFSWINTGQCNQHSQQFSEYDGGSVEGEKGNEMRRYDLHPLRSTYIKTLVQTEPINKNCQIVASLNKGPRVLNLPSSVQLLSPSYTHTVILWSPRCGSSWSESL